MPKKDLVLWRLADKRTYNLSCAPLLHYVYRLETLREAYFRLKRHAAPGIDGTTWQQYGEDLEARLRVLSLRVKRGAYRAWPVRRTYIPKAGGDPRPLGIPVLEDKIVQCAVAMVLSAIYEVDFLGFSYGFRPGRSQHDALDAVVVGIERSQVNWVLDADIRGFFDTIDHEWLMKFLEHRVADQRVLRLVRKWLKAGVLEDGTWTRAEMGTPQGGVISPLLANLYLHYVFDLWAHRWRQSAQGDVRIVRYADDFIVGFAYRREARRFLADLEERFRRFGSGACTSRRLVWSNSVAGQRRGGENRVVAGPRPSTSSASPRRLRQEEHLLPEAAPPLR